MVTAELCAGLNLPGCTNGPSGGNTWPVSSLTLGNRGYSKSDLCQIAWSNGNSGGGELWHKLFHYLIYAKLNVAAGAASPLALLQQGDNLAALCIPDPLVGKNCTAAQPNSATGQLLKATWQALHDFSLGYNNACETGEETKKRK